MAAGSFPSFIPDEPPPAFYLSNAKNAGQVWLFTDAKTLEEGYSASVNQQPMQGLNAPYVSQGSGNGFAWSLNAIINPWYAFFVSGAPPNKAIRTKQPFDQSAYEDYMSLKQLIAEYGPAPLMLLHMDKHPRAIEVALTQFTASIPMAQSTDYGGGPVYPNTIPITMAMVERQRYGVLVS